MKFATLVMEREMQKIDKKDVHRKNRKKIVRSPIKNNNEALIKESDSTGRTFYVTHF